MPQYSQPGETRKPLTRHTSLVVMYNAIAYHGTVQPFETFLLPEQLDSSFRRYTRGMLGIYFTESRDVARAFTRNHWYDKTSPFHDNARIIVANIKLKNPRIILPIEHIFTPTSTEGMLMMRIFYMRRGYDGLIIDKRTRHEEYAAAVKPYVCEYSARQIIVFNTDSINIIRSYKVR